MLYQFLLYSKVNQLYIYIYLLFKILFPYSHYRVLNGVPCQLPPQSYPSRSSKSTEVSSPCYTPASHQRSISQLLVCVCHSLPIHPTLPFPLCVHTPLLYVCISVPALQIGSSALFCQIPYTYVNIQYLKTIIQNHTCTPMFIHLQ